MQNAFEILAGFLDRAEPEVEGRTSEPPPEGVQAQLRAFARGTLAEHEQPQLMDQLNRNRHWIALLAAEVKALRPPTVDNPRRAT